MPGGRINRTQVARYMEHLKEMEQEAAAANAGISVRSSRRVERAGGLPVGAWSGWRTRSPLHGWPRPCPR